MTLPKRTKKVYNKLAMLSKLKTGQHAKLRGKSTNWRRAIMLHQEENGTIFSIRTTPEGVYICRNK